MTESSTFTLCKNGIKIIDNVEPLRYIMAEDSSGNLYGIGTSEELCKINSDGNDLIIQTETYVPGEMESNFETVEFRHIIVTKDDRLIVFYYNGYSIFVNEHNPTDLSFKQQLITNGIDSEYSDTCVFANLNYK